MLKEEDLQDLEEQKKTLANHKVNLENKKKPLQKIQTGET